MSHYTKIALAAAIISSLGGMAYAEHRTENDALSVKQAKISMAQAVTTAEQHANGRAARAEYEQSKGKFVYDVEVVGESKVFDVKVDPANGSVLSSTEDKVDRSDRDNDQED